MNYEPCTRHMVSPVKIWRNQRKIAKLVGKTGTIISWTLIRVPPEGFASYAPYPVVIVKLDGGERLTVQLVDWIAEDLEIGRWVRTVVRKIGEADSEGVLVYGIKAKPL
jgi:uncharacterized OB-fold protein